MITRVPCNGAYNLHVGYVKGSIKLMDVQDLRRR